MNAKIYSKLVNTSADVIINSRSLKWGDFEFTNGYTKHYISDAELLKPYLISYTYYNTTEYEDEILLINNIKDPYEVVPGTEIKIPKVGDIQQFILDHTK